MNKNRRFRIASLAAAFFLSVGGMHATSATAQQPATPTFKVAEQEIDDLKAVFATVRSKDLIEARVRTGGTIAALKVEKGAQVEPGQVLAIIADPKIALKIKALDAQLLALGSRLATAKSDFERADQLKERGVISQSKYDQLRTAFDVATNDLKAAQAERAVVEKQIEEGQVLAPASGRVLQVPVTEGSVMMMGESVATVAANGYLLRLELPERHARFMETGAKVKVGARGLSPENGTIGEGRIVQVYPELQGGRVIADAEVSELGNYFVGERTMVWISAGKRTSIVVPRDYVFQRFGLDYVKVATDKGAPLDVVVQLGRPAGLDGKSNTIEVLTGLKSGDQLVRP
jgi:RND family efflux transporter MFP subunit